MTRKWIKKTTGWKEKKAKGSRRELTKRVRKKVNKLKS